MDIFNDCRNSKENQLQADVCRLPWNAVPNRSIINDQITYGDGFTGYLFAVLSSFYRDKHRPLFRVILLNTTPPQSLGKITRDEQFSYLKRERFHFLSLYNAKRLNHKAKRR